MLFEMFLESLSFKQRIQFSATVGIQHYLLLRLLSDRRSSLADRYIQALQQFKPHTYKIPLLQL